jgi:aryl-alcohol dehydrogenase-like predicted oxidoreductase
MEALELLIQKGKIKAAGVCNYSSDLLAEAEKTITLASNQVPYSMVRRDIEKDIVPHCIKRDIGILAYSPIQRGLLSGKIKPGHKFNEGDTRPDTPYFKEPNLSNILDFLEKIRPVAYGHNATLAQLVLNWTIQQPGITCALAGARNPSQVMENAGAAAFRLTGEEIKLINKYISDIHLDIK